MLPELRQLVADEPLREHLWADLMLALYRSDRQADALDAYQELRGILLEELGLEPCEALQELEGRILLHDPGLEVLPTPPPHRLPTPASSFVGREGDIRRITKQLAARRLVTLHGPGGVGKSRLAIEVGRRVLPDVPDGVWWVDLANVRAADAVLDRVAASLGVTPAPGVAAVDAVAAHVRDRTILVVLDDCEHVVEAAARVPPPPPGSPPPASPASDRPSPPSVRAASTVIPAPPSEPARNDRRSIIERFPPAGRAGCA